MMSNNRYKILSKQDLSKIVGGWGYSLVFRNGWTNFLNKWKKR